MKRFVLIILVALFTLAVLLFIYNPQVLDKVWLWIVGLIGPIVAFIRNGASSLADVFKKDKEEDNPDKRQPDTATQANGREGADLNQGLIANYESKISLLEDKVAELEGKLREEKKTDDFTGETLTVLRFFDDKETTLGLLFLEEKFFCYTLEDTYRKTKVRGKTRISAGTYRLAWNREVTPLTKKYRESRSWFEYHLHVKDVPNYTGIYIHSGSTHEHTEGCLLVADSIYSSSEKRSIFNSRKTYEILYKKLKPILDQEKPVRIRYYDENWFESTKLSHLKI